MKPKGLSVHLAAAYVIARRRMGFSEKGLPSTRHLEGDIWEIRLTNDRILFAHWKDNQFVLLHHYVKKSRKIPQREIDQAKRNLKKFLERSE